VSELLDDITNLQILEQICSGVGVDVNISELAREFKKHRNTIKSQVNNLFEHDIINRPVYPFLWLHQEYPLLAVARAELPRSEELDKWFKEDKNIFAAFYVRDEEYNTLMIEYHEDIHEYGRWKKKIVRERRIPPPETRHPTHVLMFSNRDMIKYQHYSPIVVMEDRFENGELTEINGLKMNKLNFYILKKLITGQGLRTNENMLAKELNLHRRTIERRISSLLHDKIVTAPICRFPRFFVPPDHLLVYYLMEIKRAKNNVLQAISMDPNIPLAIEAGIGRYNVLLFGVFPNLDDNFRWEEKYDQRFKDCVGAMKKIYLLPEMAVSIDQQKVSLGIIKRKMELLE